jgi:hypothetical protein
MSSKAEVKLPRLYFNEYIAGALRTRSDFEAINTDLLYFCLLMKSNQYAKEVYFLRKAKRPDEEIAAVYNHLTLMRTFILTFYEVDAPNPKFIQNERDDPLELLDKLPLDGTESSTRDLGSLARECSLPDPETTSVDEDAGEASPRREATPLPNLEESL